MNKKIIKKILSIILSITVLISTINIDAYAGEDNLYVGDKIRATESVGWDGITKECTSDEGDCAISFELEECWDDGYNASVKIKNTGEEIIHNWYLAYNKNYKIKNIWNAKITDADDEFCIVKNAGWNQDILPGQTVEFGFTGDGEFTGFPTEYRIVTNNIEVETEAYSVKYNVNSDWGSGFTGNIVITNNSEKTLEDWAIEFDFDRNISNIWNGEIIFHEQNHYMISNAGYNCNIEPGQSVSFGFVGSSGNIENQPEICKLFVYDIYAIEYVELADGKIDKSYIEKAIYPRLVREGLSIEDVRLSDDYDDDGLSLIEEYDYDTNPFSIDSDEDGLNDYDEVTKYKTNPINYDTDSDDMGDGTEISSGLNPLINDSDGDGIFDNCEIVTQQVRLESRNTYELAQVDTLPQVKLTGKGDYSKQIYAQAIEFDETILDIECLVGTAFEFVHEDDLQFEKGVLSFKISDEVLKKNDFNDLAIAWYNEELNTVEILETKYDNVNNIISAEVEHFSIYMVVSSKAYFIGIGPDDYDSILKAGKADIIFVVDSTGSMGDEITNVRDNIDEFVSKLEHDSVDVRLGLVEYKDIYEDGYGSTRAYNWYSDVEEFKTQLSSLKVTGGGDAPESVVDALECAQNMGFRKGVNKFIIVITDASYKNGTSQDRNITLEDEINDLKLKNICVSVVTLRGYFSAYNALIEKTGGVLIDINQNFAIGFMPIISNIGMETNSGTWIRLANGNAYKLDADPSLGDENIDTDNDGIPDLDELNKEITISTYNPTTGKIERYQVWTYTSNPAKADSDGDKISDFMDINPLKYDITVVKFEEGKIIEFNTGRVWKYLGCTMEDYLANFFEYTIPNFKAKNPMTYEELLEVEERVLSNAKYSFSLEELIIIGLNDNNGSRIYMDNVSESTRDAVFKNISGRDCKYYQRKGILWWTTWEEVPYGTSDSFFKGKVYTEADLNFTSGIFIEFDIYDVIEIVAIIDCLLIAEYVIYKVTPCIAANLYAIIYYVKNFGIKQGLEMYRYIGTACLPDVPDTTVGLLTLIQMDLADGDSTLDDWAEKGGNYAYPNAVNNLLNGRPELNGTTREKLLNSIQNNKLYKIVEQLYRPNATIGDGGTASVLVNEFNNGQGKHLQKAIERLAQLKELYKVEKLNLSDMDIIEALIQDLEYAINLFR